MTDPPKMKFPFPSPCALDQTCTAVPYIILWSLTLYVSLSALPRRPCFLALSSPDSQSHIGAKGSPVTNYGLPTYPPFPRNVNEAQGIFVYGTLMAKSLLSCLLTGSSLSLRQPAIFKIYRRMPVKHGDYPAVIKGSTSDQVDGFLVIPASTSQWKKLDDFEGENYRRECVQVYLTQSNTTVACAIYG